MTSILRPVLNLHSLASKNCKASPLTISTSCKALFYAACQQHRSLNVWHLNSHRGSPPGVSSNGLRRPTSSSSSTRCCFSSYNQMSKSIDEFSDLFNKGKYFSLVNRFEANYIKNSNYDLPISCINMVTASLLLLNTRESHLKLKEIVQVLEQSSVKISDESKIHVFLSAINQNDAYFALGYITLAGLDKQSPTLFMNLKVISLCKINNLNEALNILGDILKLKLNKFVNEGGVFPLTIESLESGLSSSSSLSSSLRSKFNQLNQKIIAEDRLINMDLLQFSIKSISKSDSLFKVNLATRSKSDKVVTANAKKRTEQSGVEQSGNKKQADKSTVAATADLNQQVHNLFFDKQYSTLVDLFISSRNSEKTTMKPQTLRYLTKSIIQLKLNDSEKLDKVVDTLKKSNDNLSDNSLIEIFMAYIQAKKPLKALEFVAAFDKNEGFRSRNPSLYNNILIVGFSLLNRQQVALDRLKLIFDQQLDAENKLSGKIFSFTLKCLLDSIGRMQDKKLKEEYDKLASRAVQEKRITTLDLEHLPDIH